MNDTKSFLYIFQFRLSQAYEEFGLLIKLGDQLITDSLGEKHNQVGIENGPNNMTIDVCDKSATTEPTSDRSPYAFPPTAKRCSSSPCYMSNEKSLGLTEFHLESDNGPALSKSTPMSSSPSATQVSDEYTVVDVSSEIVPLVLSATISNGANLDETSDSCPSLVDYIETCKEEELHLGPCHRPRVSRWEWDLECNESLNKEHIGFFESIVGNVKSFEMPRNYSAADQLVNTASTSANLSSVEHSYHSNASTPPEAAATLDLPELMPTLPLLAGLADRPTPANLLPILPEPIPDVPDLDTLTDPSACGNYLLFPPPHDSNNAWNYIFNNVNKLPRT